MRRKFKIVGMTRRIQPRPHATVGEAVAIVAATTTRTREIVNQNLQEREGRHMSTNTRRINEGDSVNRGQPCANFRLVVDREFPNKARKISIMCSQQRSGY